MNHAEAHRKLQALASEVVSEQTALCETRIRIARLDQITNARFIQQSSGTRAAAGYMAAYGWSLEAALWILCNKPLENITIQ